MSRDDLTYNDHADNQILFDEIWKTAAYGIYISFLDKGKCVFRSNYT